jgi:hypothetical protein
VILRAVWTAPDHPWPLLASTEPSPDPTENARRKRYTCRNDDVCAAVRSSPDRPRPVRQTPCSKARDQSQDESHGNDRHQTDRDASEDTYSATTGSQLLRRQPVLDLRIQPIQIVPHSQVLLYHAGTLGTTSVGFPFFSVWSGMSLSRSSSALLSMAAFLVVGTAGLFGSLITRLMLRRRQRMSRSDMVPHDVRLRVPSVAQAELLCQVVACTSIPSAIVAGLASTHAAIWVGTISTTVWGGVLIFWELLVGSAGLTIESSGLRIHVSRASFLVPWAEITKVELSTARPVHLLISIRSISGALKTLTLTGGRRRDLIRIFTFDSVGRIKLAAGLGGFDAPVLRQAISTLVARDTNAPN